MRRQPQEERRKDKNIFYLEDHTYSLFKKNKLGITL